MGFHVKDQHKMPQMVVVEENDPWFCFLFSECNQAFRICLMKVNKENTRDSVQSPEQPGRFSTTLPHTQVILISNSP